MGYPTAKAKAKSNAMRARNVKRQRVKERYFFLKKKERSKCVYVCRRNTPQAAPRIVDNYEKVGVRKGIDQDDGGHDGYCGRDGTECASGCGLTNKLVSQLT